MKKFFGAVLIVGIALALAVPAVAGPEPNTFVCPSAPSGSPPHVICKTYFRSGGAAYPMKVGNANFGFRHIRARRGFSAKTDHLIDGTISSGTKEDEGGGSYRLTRRYSSTCLVRVIYSTSQHSIITAYKVYGNGYFDTCP